MPQLSGWTAAVQQRRLQDRMAGEGALRAGGVDAAARLALEVPVPADVVGVGVGVVDGQPFLSSICRALRPASLSLPLSMKHTSVSFSRTRPILAGLCT